MYDSKVPPSKVLPSGCSLRIMKDKAGVADGLSTIVL